MLLITLAAAACSSGGDTDTASSGDPDPTEVPGTTPSDPTAPNPAEPDPAEPDPAEPDPGTPPELGAEPEPYVPRGPIGNEADYQALVAKLSEVIPPDLVNEVPWPDTRNPDPAQVQIEIFDLWIWMAANHPEPQLAEIMAAAGSPSREEIAGIFGEMDRSGELATRDGDPYVAFDHRVVTFESAGLPLWLGRDVPADAVVVYYQDRSGPVTTRDRATGQPLATGGAVDARQWLSIMVPTDVGWLLFRDQLIEPGDSELEVPDQTVPSPDATSRTPEV